MRERDFSHRDLGSPTAPGIYKSASTGIRVELDDEDIAEWKKIGFRNKIKAQHITSTDSQGTSAWSVVMFDVQ